MHIVVADDNVKRHEDHENSLVNLNISRYEIKKSIDLDTIPHIKAEIILLHKSNKEFSQIESSDNLGKIRIFFSDGTLTEYIKDEYNYYVPFDSLYDVLKTILNEIQVRG